MAWNYYIALNEDHVASWSVLVYGTGVKQERLETIAESLSTFSLVLSRLPQVVSFLFRFWLFSLAPPPFDLDDGISRRTRIIPSLHHYLHLILNNPSSDSYFTPSWACHHLHLKGELETMKAHFRDSSFSRNFQLLMKLNFVKLCK